MVPVVLLAFLGLLTQCHSPLTLGNDTKSIVEDGLAKARAVALARLSATGTSGVSVHLSPSFDPERLTYFVNWSSPVTLVPVEKVKGQVLGYQLDGSGAWTQWSSGQPLPSVGFGHTVSVRVTALNGVDTRLYQCSIRLLGVGTPLTPSATVSTLAGSTTSGSSDGTGSGASFNMPCGVTSDGTNVYVADTYNNEIRQVVIATGVTTTLAGSTASGWLDGTGSAARFSHPWGVATDGSKVYVADQGNHRIRAVDLATHQVSTLAGGSTAGSLDGTGTAAQFNGPRCVATDGLYVYVADYGNNEIRQIDLSTGAVTTVAGSTTLGSANGIGTAASFTGPMGIATDGANLYVTEYNNHEIRKINLSTREVTTVAGVPATTGWVDAIGSAARFNHPAGITTDGTNLYVADQYNFRVRVIVLATGAVSTLAGSGSSGSTDGVATSASFKYINQITSDGVHLFVGDTSGNSAIRMIQ